MPAILIHECPLARFGDRAGGFIQLRYPDAIVIPLSQGKFVIVDSDVYPSVSDYRWIATKVRRTQYAQSGEKVNGRQILLHDLITPWDLTDHRDGNGLDCRMSNMRDATQAQNNANHRTRSDNTSGHRGIRLWGNGRYRVMIQGEHAGMFDTFDGAVTAYHSEASKRFGQFAPHCC